MVSNIIDVVKKIEIKYPVECIKYKDIYLWPYFRWIIFSHYHNGSRRSGKKAGKAIKLAHKIFMILKAIKAFGNSSCDLLKKRQETVVYYTTSEMTKIVNGKKVDRLLQQVIETVGGTVVPFVIPINKTSETAFSKYIDANLLYAIIEIESKFIKVKRSEIQYIDVIEQIFGELGIEPFSIEGITNKIIASKTFFEHVFKKINPKFLFIVCYYDIYRMAASNAAKKMGIPVIELEHGTISEISYEYITYKNIKDNPYPTYMFCFGEKFKLCMPEFIYSPDNIKIIGSYYLETVKAKKEENKTIFLNKHPNAAGKIVITVASQRNVDKEILEFFLQLADLMENIYIIFKPRELCDYHTGLCKNNLVIEKELDIYQCMQNSSITSAVGSTCVFESLYLGVPVMIYNLRGLSKKFAFGNIFDNLSSVFYVENLDGAMKVINKLEIMNSSTVSREGQLFYADNHKKLVAKAIREINEVNCNE